MRDQVETGVVEFEWIPTREMAADSATTDPEAWKAGLQRLVEAFREMQEEYRTLLEINEDAKRHNDEMRTKTTALSKRTKDATIELQLERDPLARLRSLRDRWRDDAEGLAKENEELKEKLKKLPASLEAPEVDSEQRGVGDRHLSAAESAWSFASQCRALQCVATTHACHQPNQPRFYL